jgi:hypothetical protein
VTEPSAAASQGPGHVFVLNGRLEHLRADVHIVPTDRSFDVQRSWWPVFHDEPLATVKPTSWAQDRSGKAAGQDGIWFLDLVRPSVEELTTAVAEVLRKVAADLAGHARVTGRSRPLVAMPPVGGGRGGFRERRGDVIAALLETLEFVDGDRVERQATADGHPFEPADHVVGNVARVQRSHVQRRQRWAGGALGRRVEAG